MTDDGQRTTPDEQRMTDNEERSMVDGRRSAVDSQRSVDHGRRPMVGGRWSAANGRRSAVKVLEVDAQKAVVAGYGIVFHTSDLAGDTFLPDTDFGLTRICTGMPVYYDHATRHLKTPIGQVLHAQSDEHGIWFELELDRHRAYVDQVLKLVETGVVGLSTGAIAHLVQREQGVLKSWIIGEVSLTPTPCEVATIPVTRIKSGAMPRWGIARQEARAPMDETVTHPGDNLLAHASVGEHGLAPASAGVLARIDQLEMTLKTLMDAPAIPRSGFVVPGDTAVQSGSRAVEQSSSRAEEDERAIKAFERYLRTGAKATLQEGTASEGGYLVPARYSNQIVTALKDMSILRMAGARVLRVSGSDSFKVPTVTSTAAAVLTSENQAFDEAEPTFAEIEFKPYKYTRLAKVSDELLLDSRFDVVDQVLIPDYAQAFAAAENQAFTLGTGSSQPQGLVAGATQLTDTGTSQAFGADDVITLYHKLNYLYRQRAVWLMHDLTAKVVRTFKDATSGQYLWQPGLQAGTPDRLLGRPVYTLNVMDSLTGSSGQTAGKKFLAFCDPAYFWIVDFGLESIRRLDELYASMGQVGFRAYRRVDSHIMLQEAIQVMKVKA